MNRMLKAMLLAMFGLVAFPSSADWVRENELTPPIPTCEAVACVSLDCRTAFPVLTLKNEPSLQNLAYSAVGWDLDPVPNLARTVKITAQSGVLIDGVFLSDGAPELTVMPATEGRGTIDWQVTSISKKIYRLKHVVKQNGLDDGSAMLYGYLDFTGCRDDVRAPQNEVEAAVLGRYTHKVAVMQDADFPWQPIIGSGIETDRELEAGAVTVTSFSFVGVGTFHYEYALNGGSLEIVTDGASTVLEVPLEDWATGAVEVREEGVHEIAFVYKSDGDGTAAGLRNVVWEEQSERRCASDVGDSIRVDLQEGDVRTPKKFSYVLPFAYSPTNFTGTVDGMSSRVSIVQIEGTDLDVMKWVSEVAGTARVLKDSTDEGEVVWKAKRGVWKVTFEILDGATVKDVQTKLLDLRNATGNGLVIMLF